jgi:hypothetical protein
MDRRPCFNVLLAVLLLGGGLLAAEGCGKSKVERHPLAGRVTFQGKPVPVGQIVFEPDVRQGNRGPQGYAEIFDGHYRTDKHGKGVMIGAMTVEISGFPPTDGSGGKPDAPLFAPYKTTAQVTEGTTTLDFDVPSQR